MTYILVRTTAFAALLLLPHGRVTTVSHDLSAAQALPDVMTRSIAAYAALKTYSDSGTVEVESPGMIDRAKFTTYFRRPNGDLYLDYQAIETYYTATKIKVDLNMYRTVIWMLKGQMETYDRSLQTHNIIDAGGQAQALTGATAATNGISRLAPSLLYPQAKMRSTFSEIEEASDAGFENVGKYRCHKITGIAAQYYPSGARTGVRPVTVWIDADTLLLRKVFEDTPKGYGLGAYRRVTVTIDPQPNIALDDAKFQFKVPSQ
jgi:hypothetical protein